MGRESRLLLHLCAWAGPLVTCAPCASAQGTYDNIRKLRNFLRKRPHAGKGEHLSFDDFTELYNEYVMEGYRQPPTYRAAPASPSRGGESR